MAIATVSRSGPLRDRPLAWHLAVLCFALALPMIALAGVLARFYVGSERARIEEDALRKAHQIIAASDLELAGLIAAANVLAVARSLQRGDLEAFDGQARDVFRKIGVNVVLRDRDSRQLVNTGLPRGAPLPSVVNKEPDQAVLQTKRPFVSNLFIGAVARHPMYIVDVPVLRGGEIVYFLSLRLEPGQMRDVILQTDLTAGWEAAIADRRGVVIAHSSRQEAMLNQPLPVLTGTETRRDGVVRRDGALGDPGSALAAFSRSQLSGWVAVVSVPADQVAAPLRRSLIVVGALGAVVAALSLGLALVFARRIDAPVDALAFQALRVGRGEAAPPLATPVREVNMLSNVLYRAHQQRQEADVALRLSEERYRTLASSTREGVAVVDRWRVVDCNDAFWMKFGYASRDQLLGRRTLALFAEAARKTVVANARRGERAPYEAIGRRADGASFPVELSCSPAVYQGRAMHVLIVRDLTAAKAAETALRESEQRLHELQLELLHASRLSAMGQMAAALAHELNQPLGAATNFLGAARLALEATRPDAPARAMARIDKAIEQTVRAGAILGRLRDFIAHRETEKQIVSARQLLADAVALALVGARDPRPRIRFDFTTDGRPVLVDRIQIQQVVFNLVRNALEATQGRAGREITVATRAASAGELEICVADNGPGLGPDPEAVFRPFASTKPDGMGIGLSICRAIIEAHGGRLWAERRAEGGAAFRFTVPTAPAEETVHG